MAAISASFSSSCSSIWAAAPALADLETLTTGDFRSFLAWRRNQGTESRSLSRQLSALRSFYLFLERTGTLKNSALSALRSPKIAHSVPKPLSPEAARRLIAPEATDDGDTLPWIAARDTAVLTLLYGCGLRISEAVALTVNDLSRDPMMITGKGGKARLVPVLPVARDAVAAYQALCPFSVSPKAPLFRGLKGGPLNARNIQLLIARLRGALGLPDTATPHALAPFIRDASFGQWRRSSRHPGIARPCQPVDHADLYRGQSHASFRAVYEGASPHMTRRVGLLRILACAGFLVWSATPLWAEAPTCTGKDLIEELRAANPSAYAALRAEAEAIPNNHGLLWKIEPASGAAPSYLFGTVHVTDRRVHALRAPVKAALDKASTIVVESTEALNSTEMAKHMFAVAPLMVLPDAQTLADVIPPADLAIVKSFYEKEGGLDAHLKYRPYMLAMMLSYAPCEVARQTGGLLSLDADIAATTEMSHAKLAGLETLLEQFTSMSDMPMPQQVDWLLQAIELRPQIDDFTETLVRLYLAQETGMLLAWSRNMTLQQGNVATWDSFKSLLIDTRNKTDGRARCPIYRGRQGLHRRRRVTFARQNRPRAIAARSRIQGDSDRLTQ